ncbi:MAG: hypothetical protein SGILL_000049 [Bacillariaceae sp.]
MSSSAEAEVPAPEAAPAAKTDEILKVVDDQEQPEVFKSAVDIDNSIGGEDVTEGEDKDDWKEVLPPPQTPTKPEEADEAYEAVPTKPVPETPTTVATGQTQQQQKGEEKPDFSNCKTDVGRRLWEAQETAEKAGVKSSSDLVPLTRDFQQYRKKMNTLIKLIDEYSEATNIMKAKRQQLFNHYAMMSKGTPIWDHVGKPLTPEQMTEIQHRGDETTPESIELQSKSILKVADEIGPGSLIALQELAAMQDKLDDLDYKTHIVDYVDEWDDVVTSEGDKEVKAVMELTKKREHYVHKVDKLRNKVNRIEHRGVRDAAPRLQQKLDRNEDKLEKADDMYEDKSNDLAVVLKESVQKGWIDLYPLIKNSMKYEVNRLGRESSTFGRLTGTLGALKIDYKDATKGTGIAPEK